MTKTFFPLILLLLAALCLPESRGQILLIGRDERDQVSLAFFGQNGNASNVVHGLNTHAGTNRFDDDLIPLTLLGTNRVLVGGFTGTNAFGIRTYDTTLGDYQVFHFTFDDELPGDTNTVSRTGYPETLLWKVLNQVRFQTNGVDQTGVIVAMGADPAKAVAGMSGTNRVYIRHAYSTDAATNWFEWVDGVLTDVR